MIPKLHYITQGNTPDEHLENILKACMSGAELVQLRLKKTDQLTILKTAKKAREITAQFQTRLIINDHYKIAKEVKADGVHLGKLDGCPLIARKFLGQNYLIGGTANSIQDCEELLIKQVDYIGLGPFRFTTTKENLSPEIKMSEYHSIIAQLKSQTPIIAVGGITINDVNDILSVGVYGVAVSNEITKNFNNIHLFNKSLNDSASKEQVWKIN